MNRLAHETSPYLLQHKDNPVDWYPWGEEALRRAQEEQRPIFLSIGYSACHWCHVMEHESFENEEIANQLNDRFVCIKVDREERPDLDQIYMNAVQMMTRHGGWPMSVFLTPDLQPFYGGTYWPPKRSRGMPGFDEVLAGVYDAWVNRQDQVVEQAAQITSYLQQPLGTADQSTTYDRAFFGSLVSELEQTFDFTYGGFGRAPKFPHTMDLQVLLRVWRDTSRSRLLEMVKLNLDKMARGGIYDHLAGGFARYSVDERWLVPHFEKMLYDNALLIGAYLDGFLATGDQSYATVVRETSDFILGYMRDEQGGFHSTEDADSEGVEGKFYVWSLGEVGQVLGKDLAARFSYVFDVTESGNFEGQNILNLGKTLQQCADLKDWNLTELEDQMASCKERLLAVRDQRVRPGKDDKVLVSWNALMIDALARAGMALEEPAYLTAAANAARFILDQLRRSDGRLLHSWRHGSARFDAYLDDYAYLSNALVSLYQADFDERWIDEAVSLADVMLERFHDSAAGGFFFTADDHEKLIARNKDLQDASVPSGNAMAATALLRLAALCGRLDYRAAAEGAIELGSDLIQRAPSAAGQMAVAAHMLASAFPEIVIIADPQDAATKQVLASLRSRYLPNHVLALRAPRASGYQSPHLQPLFEGRESMDGQLTLFVCQQFTCRQPVVGLDAAIQACRSI